MDQLTYRAGELIAAAQKLGLAVVIAAEHPLDIPSASPEAQLSIQLHDPVGAAKMLVEFAGKHPVDAVVAPEAAGAEIAARSSKALKLPHSSLEALQAAGNKTLMREKLQAAGIKTPQFWRFKISDGPEKISGLVKFPCVIKPLNLSGKLGLVRVDQPDALADGLARLRALLESAAVQQIPGVLTGELIVEEYISGEEAAQEGVLVDGDIVPMVLFDKTLAAERGSFIEETYITPSKHASEGKRKAFMAALRACGALGLTHGPVHVDVIFRPEDTYVIDVSPRTVGGYVSKAAGFGTGRTQEEVVLRNALGEDHQIIRRENSAAGILMITAKRTGRLENVAGTGEAEKVKNVEEILITLNTGQDTISPQGQTLNIGHIVSRAANREAVEKALHAAFSKINFTFTGG